MVLQVVAFGDLGFGYDMADLCKIIAVDESTRHRVCAIFFVHLFFNFAFGKEVLY